MKTTPQDWVELFCLGAIFVGVWVEWGFGVSIVVVGGIGLSVALFARRRPKREGTG